MVESEKREEVSFNIAADQARFVGELMKTAVTEYLRGDLGSWFKYLTALREVCNHDLKKPEKKLLNDMEKELWSLKSSWDIFQQKANIGHKVDDKTLSDKSKFASKIRVYQRKLFRYMKELGYFPSKEDRSKLSF